MIRWYLFAHTMVSRRRTTPGWSTCPRMFTSASTSRSASSLFVPSSGSLRSITFATQLRPDRSCTQRRTWAKRPRPSSSDSSYSSAMLIVRTPSMLPTDREAPAPGDAAGAGALAVGAGAAAGGAFVKAAGDGAAASSSTFT